MLEEEQPRVAEHEAGGLHPAEFAAERHLVIAFLSAANAASAACHAVPKCVRRLGLLGAQRTLAYALGGAPGDRKPSRP